MVEAKAWGGRACVADVYVELYCLMYGDQLVFAAVRQLAVLARVKLVSFLRSPYTILPIHK